MFKDFSKKLVNDVLDEKGSEILQKTLVSFAKDGGKNLQARMEDLYFSVLSNPEVSKALLSFHDENWDQAMLKAVDGIDEIKSRAEEAIDSIFEEKSTESSIFKKGLGIIEKMGKTLIKKVDEKQPEYLSQLKDALYHLPVITELQNEHQSTRSGSYTINFDTNRNLELDKKIVRPNLWQKYIKKKDVEYHIDIELHNSTSGVLARTSINAVVSPNQNYNFKGQIAALLSDVHKYRSTELNDKKVKSNITDSTPANFTLSDGSQVNFLRNVEVSRRDVLGDHPKTIQEITYEGQNGITKFTHSIDAFEE